MAPPAAPTSTKEQVGAALQTADQYAGGSTVWTPQNAEELGLDPARGYVTRGTSTDVPIPSPTPAPVEKPPPSMAPGLGTPGGAPMPEKIPAHVPEKTPAAKTGTSAYPGAIPDDQRPKEDQQPKQRGYEGAIPDEEPKPEAKKETSAYPGAIPDEEPKQPQAPPSAAVPTPQPQPQQPETPMPSGTGAGAPQGLPGPLVPGRQAHIKALIASGKTPGEAQAIADGQEPKTLNGETPQPKPAPAPKTEQPQQPQGDTVDWGRLGYKSFEDYQKFVTGLPAGMTVTRGPGTTATITKGTQAEPSTPAVPEAPSTTTTTTEEPPKVVEGNKIQGTSTIFGLNYDGSVDPDDNGRGFFGGVNTRNPNLKGVAVPVDVLEKTFGHFAQVNAQGTYDMVDTPEARAIVKAIQSAHVEAIGPDGKIHKFPIVDIQGSLKGHPGKVLDLTYGAAKDMGFTDNHGISYQIIGGDGKPYPIPDNIEFAGGGGGKGGGGAGGGALAGQPLFSVPVSGGGSRRAEAGPPQQAGGWSGDTGGGTGGGAPGAQPAADSIDILGGVLAGVGLGSLFGRGRAGPSQAPAEAEPPPAGGIKPANVFSVRTISPGPPPPAPSSLQAQLLPPPAAPTLPSTSAAAQPAMAPLKGPDPAVIKALMKRGFTRQQAEAFAAKATVSKPGTAALTGGASFKPPTQPSAAPPAKAPIPAKQAPPAAPAAKAPSPSDVPPAVFESASHNMRPLGYRAAVKLPNGEVFSGAEHAHALDNAAENASMRVNDATTSYGFVDKNQHFVSMDEADRILERHWYKQRNLPEPPSLATEPTEYAGAREGSTRGVANPPAFSALEGLKLADAVRQHAGLLSDDDPRVKKQADRMFKGEHFVPGDPVHEPALEGLPGGHRGRQRQILGQAEQAISDKSPLHISYISAPKEADKFPTRESRRVQYDEHSPEARLMGTTVGQLVGHSMIPVSVGVKFPTKAGEPHQSYIQGISTNILANNFQHVNDKLAAIGRKTPYQQLGQKFFNDLEGYYANLNAGHTATGRGHVLGTEEHPSEPDRDHVPYKLSRLEADFIGTVLNNTEAFAKHGDAEALRKLARINGTLITPEGETNRLRHEIEQHEPGWRQRVLEPSIRSFKTGLIHEVHPDEEHMPATIRPGKEFQDLTRAIARTSERGRPDVPVAASLHHTFADNKAINQIERDFSQERITEQEARARLHALGEDPDEFQFIGGSGGLITPYEENPEAITPEEHTELKSNLRKQWIGGKMPIEDYRRKAAEVPLPEKPSQPLSSSPAAPEEASAQLPKLQSVKKPKSPAPEGEPEEPETHEEVPETPLTAPKPAVSSPKAKPAPKAPQEPSEAPDRPGVKTPLEEGGPPAQPGAGATPGRTVATPPAPGDILPPAKKATKAKTKEQSGLEAQDFEQAAADRDDISPEDAGGLARIQKIAKAWIKKNPILHGLSMHAYLTGQKKFPGKLNKEGIGEHFDATNPQLDYSKEEHRQKASDAVVHDIMHSLAGTTTGKPSTAYGWYDRTVRKTMAKIGQIAPKILTDPDHAMAFKLALAITSQGQDVFPNAESAWHIYQHWLKHDEMPTDRKIFGGGIKAEAMEANLGKVNDLWKKHGTEGLHKILMSRMTSRELREKYGLDSGEKANHVVNGAMGLGPKIGAFFSNLNGDFDPTTIDLWFSRNMNLMAGNMFGFSDKATRQDRMEKGEVVKSHLSELQDLLQSGMISNIPQERADKMAQELAALQAHPEGKLDRPTAKALAPEIYDWAREQHKTYQKSAGYERSYHPDLKTKDNVTAKKLDEGVTGLSDDPRTTAERDHWRDIMARADQSLKGAKVHLTNADKQALLWFNIKDLFKMAGSPQRPKADYLDAAHRLVRKVKSGELPGLAQASQPSGGVLKMQQGGLVPDPDPDPALQSQAQPAQPSEVPRLVQQGQTQPAQQNQLGLMQQGQTQPAQPAGAPPPAAPSGPSYLNTKFDPDPDAPYLAAAGAATQQGRFPGGVRTESMWMPGQRLTHDLKWGAAEGGKHLMTNNDIAISQDLMKKYGLKLGDRVDVLDSQGNVLYPNQYIGDVSYRSPGKPNSNTIELWGRKDIGYSSIRPAAALED